MGLLLLGWGLVAEMLLLLLTCFCCHKDAAADSVAQMCRPLLYLIWVAHSMQAAKEGDATKVDKRRKKKQKQAEEDAAFLDDPDQDAEYQDGAPAASHNAVCMLSHLMPVIRC